jgi:ABC-type branched-subunit amino acid transport system substrate-binding protein
VIPDVPTAHGIEPLINSLVLAPRNLKLDKVVYVPLDAVDMTAQAAELSGEDVVINTLLQSNSPAFLTALRQQGSKAPIIVSAGVYGGSAVGEQFGDNADGVFLGSVFDRSSDGYAQYEKAIAAMGKEGSELDSDQATQAYLAVQLFAMAAQQVNGDVTPASVLSSVSSMNNFDFKGITPPIDFTKPGTFGGGHFPAIRNDGVTVLEYQDGKLEPQGSGFTHIFAAS